LVDADAYDRALADSFEKAEHAVDLLG